MLAQIIFLQREKDVVSSNQYWQGGGEISKQIAAQGIKNCASFEPDSSAWETCTLTVLWGAKVIRKLKYG